jgi:hypothetical protein
MSAVLWLKTNQPNYRGQSRRPREWDDTGRAMTDFRDGVGNRVMDRTPALGYEGRDPHNMHPMKGVKRFADFLRHDGHIVHTPLTNAAAHQPNEDTSCSRDRYRKARYFGWIEWPSTGPSQCPLLMAMTGQINPEQLKARSNQLSVPAVSDEERASEAADAKEWTGVPLPRVPEVVGQCTAARRTSVPARVPASTSSPSARRGGRCVLLEVKHREETAKSEEAKAAQAQILAAREQTTAIRELAASMAGGGNASAGAALDAIAVKLSALTEAAEAQATDPAGMSAIVAHLKEISDRLAGLEKPGPKK